MTSLLTATKRIDDALARLESAIENSRGSGADSESSEGQMEELRSDRDSLAGELATVRMECERLKDQKSSAATRLDGVIGRIESILGAGGG